MLTLAGIVLSKLAGPLTANEGGLGELLLEQDVVSPAIQQDHTGQMACAKALEQIGFSAGVEVERMQKYTTQCRSFQSYHFEGLVKRLNV